MKDRVRLRRRSADLTNRRMKNKILKAIQIDDHNHLVCLREFSLSLHTAPRLLFLGLLLLQNMGDNFGGQFEREADIASELLRLASLGIGNAQKIDPRHKSLRRTNEVANTLFVL